MLRLQPILLFLNLILFGINEPILAQNSKLETYIEIAKQYKYSNPDSAYFYFVKADELLGSNPSPEKAAFLKNQIGFSLYMRGKHYSSLAYFMNAVEIAKKEKITAEEAYALNGIGLIHWQQNENARAIDYFNQSLEHYKLLGDSIHISMCLKNLSRSQKNLGNYPEAIALIKEADSYLKISPDHFGHAMISNQIADNFLQLENYTEAKHYFENAIQIADIKNVGERAIAYAGLAQISLINKDIDNALDLANKSFDLSTQVKSIAELAKASNILANAYERAGDLEQSIYYLKKYHQYKDSLFNENNSKQINYLQLQFTDAEKKRLENLNALKQREADFNQKLIFIMVFMLVIASASIIFYRKSLLEKAKLVEDLATLNTHLNEQKQIIEKQNTSLQKLIKEKDHIFTVISHDLRSPFHAMEQMTEIQESGVLSESESKDIMNMLNQQIHKTRSMLDQILVWASTQMKGSKRNPNIFNLESLVSEVCEFQSRAAQFKKINLQFKNHALNSEVLADKDQVRIILQNLLGNAIKFTDSNKSISLELLENEEHVVLKIRDEGIGMNESQLLQFNSPNSRMDSSKGTSNEKGYGLGLYLVKDFLSQNKIGLEVESTSGVGTTFTLTFSFKETLVAV